MVVHLRNYIKNSTQYFVQYPDTCTSKSVFKNSATPCFSTLEPLLSVWISDETMPVVFYILVFKLVNYTWSCSQNPINDNHLGQVDESWYHHVFIWGETCFSSQIKHLHFNVLLINTTHGNNENTRENISLHNFLLFHLKRHHGLALSSVSRCLEPMMKHSPSFFTYYTKISIVSLS